MTIIFDNIDSNVNNNDNNKTVQMNYIIKQRRANDWLPNNIYVCKFKFYQFELRACWRTFNIILKAKLLIENITNYINC